jgi:flagellar assembly protein FliH
LSETEPKPERWEAPSVDGSAADSLRGVLDHSAHLLGADKLAELQNRVREEARQEGFRQGVAEGRAEVAARVARLERLLEHLARPLQQLDDVVEQELLALVQAVARHVLRREIRTDPQQIIGAVRDALAVMPASARDVRVQLNPADAALLGEHLSAGEHGFRIEEDPTLELGSCRVLSEQSYVDGRVEARLGQILAAALGEGRSADQGDG